MVVGVHVGRHFSRKTRTRKGFCHINVIFAQNEEKLEADGAPKNFKVMI